MRTILFSLALLSCDVEVTGLGPLEDTVEGAICRSCQVACIEAVVGCYEGVAYQGAGSCSAVCLYAQTRCQNACDYVCSSSEGESESE